MILQFLWESRGRLFKESYSNVTLLFFVFVHIAPYLLHKTIPSTSGWFPHSHISCASILPRVVFFHHISCVLPLLPWGGFFLVLFRKSTKNFGLSFLRVSGRRGYLKRPLRASNLVGVSAAIPTVPPFTPQNPTAEIVARIPRLCRFAEWEGVVRADVLRPRGMLGARFLIQTTFP